MFPWSLGVYRIRQVLLYHLLWVFIHFPVDLAQVYFQYQQTDSDTDTYYSVRCHTHYDITYKNNDVSFKGLDKHYH